MKKIIKRLIFNIYVYLYPILFLYRKGDDVKLLGLTPQLKTKKLKVGDVGVVCSVKYFKGEGWYYLIDFGLTFPLVNAKLVKRVGLGWLKKLKLRLLKPEDLQKESESSWTISHPD